MKLVYEVRGERVGEREIPPPTQELEVSELIGKAFVHSVAKRVQLSEVTLRFVEE